MGLSSLAIMLMLAACASSIDASDPVAAASTTVTWDPNEYEETRTLEGEELLDSLTKVIFAVEPGDAVNAEVIPAELNGDPIPGCPPAGAPAAAIIGLGDGTRACIGVGNSEEAVDIYNRFTGRSVDRV